MAEHRRTDINPVNSERPTLIFILRHRLQARVVRVQFPKPFLFRLRVGFSSDLVGSVRSSVLALDEAVSSRSSMSASSLSIVEPQRCVLLSPVCARDLDTIAACGCNTSQ